MEIHIPNEIIWVVVVGFVLSFILAFGIGANDVASSFGTSVGSKVLTLFQACVLATFSESLGAILVGQKVSETIRKGIIDPVEDFRGKEGYLLLGELSTLAAATVWLLMATFLKLPVSSSHSIVGATMGFAIVAGVAAKLKWVQLGLIVASWFISPLFAGIVSTGIFFVVKKMILDKDNAFERGLFFLPIFYGVTLAVNLFSVFFDGSRLLQFDKIPLWVVPIISAVGGLIAAVLVWKFLVPWQRKTILALKARQIESHENDVKTNDNQVVPEGDTCKEEMTSFSNVYVEPSHTRAFSENSQENAFHLQPPPSPTKKTHMADFNNHAASSDESIVIVNDSEVVNTHVELKNDDELHVRVNVAESASKIKDDKELDTEDKTAVNSLSPKSNETELSFQIVDEIKPDNNLSAHAIEDTTETSGPTDRETTGPENADVADKPGNSEEMHKKLQKVESTNSMEFLPGGSRIAQLARSSSYLAGVAPLAKFHLPTHEELEKARTQITEDFSVHKLFSYLQILTAIFGGFAHGANDVSNAIGPMITLWLMATGSPQADTPIYMLAYGGLGICLGLWLLGRRVIETLGENLTKITASSGFCIEIGSILTVLFASNLKIPISSTHCKVGAVIMVGRFRSKNNVDWSLFKNIVLSWIVTVPVSGLFSAALTAWLYYVDTAEWTANSPTVNSTITSSVTTALF